MKSKLLVVTSTFPRWEDDTDPPFVYELSRRLTSDFDITVLAPYYPGSKKNEIMSGIQVHRFSYFPPPLNRIAGSNGILPTLQHNKLYYGVLPFFLLAQCLSLMSLVRKIRPDVLHAHWLIPQGTLAVGVGKLYDVPVLLTAHGTDVFGLRGNFFRLIKRFTLRGGHRITAVSGPLAKACSDLAPLGKKMQVIPMGVDSTLFSGKKKKSLMRGAQTADEARLLFVGRLSEKKGVRLLIEAMPLIVEQIPGIRLTIVGSGELEDNLKALVERLGLLNHIRFAGSVPNKELPDYYTNADVFIGPSVTTSDGNTEGLGLTFIEASLCGCLLIGTDTGGISDIIKDNVTGFLVKPGDSKLLAEKIMYAVHNLSELNELRNMSQKHVKENYEWCVVAEKYKTLIREIVKNNTCF
jgi:glycosyltransferase involved in cell wall biosynthesis